MSYRSSSEERKHSSFVFKSKKPEDLTPVSTFFFGKSFRIYTMFELLGVAFSIISNVPVNGSTRENAFYPLVFLYGHYIQLFNKMIGGSKVPPTMVSATWSSGYASYDEDIPTQARARPLVMNCTTVESMRKRLIRARYTDMTNPELGNLSLPRQDVKLTDNLGVTAKTSQAYCAEWLAGMIVNT